MRLRRILPLMIVGVFVLSRLSGLSASEFSWSESVNGPVCGVYAACSVLRAMGIDCDESNYVKNRFVSHCGGSTPEDIREIFEEVGVSATLLGNLSTVDLRINTFPFVANVRKHRTDVRYNHWVGVVPQRSGVLVFDGTDRGRHMPYAEFFGIWSGIAVFATDGSSSIVVKYWMWRLATILCILLAILLAVYVLPLPIFSICDSRRIHGVFILLSITTAASVFGNLLFADVGNLAAGIRSATAHNNGPIPVQSLLSAPESNDRRYSLLIDARYARDFARGSIPGAVSVPVTASDGEIKEFMKSIEKSTPILVFCQSQSCSFDETVAQLLIAFGFTRVAVSDIGWSEYCVRQSKSTVANEENK